MTVVQNRTVLSDGEVVSVVKWTLELVDADFDCLGLRIFPTLDHMHSGKFYPDAIDHNPSLIRGFPPAVTQLVIGQIPYVPSGWNDTGVDLGPPAYMPATWQECLVCLTAHEAYHVTQWLMHNDDRDNDMPAEWAEHDAWRRWTERRIK